MTANAVVNIPYEDFSELVNSVKGQEIYIERMDYHLERMNILLHETKGMTDLECVRTTIELVQSILSDCLAGDLEPAPLDTEEISSFAL